MCTSAAVVSVEHSVSGDCACCARIVSARLCSNLIVVGYEESVRGTVSTRAEFFTKRFLLYPGEHEFLGGYTTLS